MVGGITQPLRPMLFLPLGPVSYTHLDVYKRQMRKHCTKLHHTGDVLEIVGTGGDEAYTFNISTISALVVASAGVPVAKHGNRSVSSQCGSADVLEALGVKIDLSVEQSARILKEVGICFMFAQIYHASMKYAAPVSYTHLDVYKRQIQRNLQAN